MEKKLLEANEALKNKKYDEAILIYEEILKTNDVAEIHFNLGLVLKIQNKLDAAEASFSKAISLKSDFVLAHYQLGNTKYKLNKFDESEICYQNAISLKNNFLEAYINLARAQRELRKFKEAEDNLRIAQKLNPDFLEVNVLLGLILFDRGRLSDDLKHRDLDKLNESKMILSKSIKSNPNYAFAHQNLGLVQQELGDLNDAKVSFEEALKLEPNSIYANQNLQILLNQIKILNELGISKDKSFNNSDLLKRFNKIPFITHKEPDSTLIDLLYEINSTELNKTKGGPLFGNGKTSDYNLLENNNNPILINLKKELIDIINKETNSNVLLIDSFFNILGAGGGSVPHHHLNSFDKTFKLDQQKFSLTYYLSVGDQNCDEPGIFKIYEPDEDVLPSNGMIMIIPSSRKHSAVYGGKKDRVMIGVNFYLYN